MDNKIVLGKILKESIKLYHEKLKPIIAKVPLLEETITNLIGRIGTVEGTVNGMDSRITKAETDSAEALEKVDEVLSSGSTGGITMNQVTKLGVEANTVVEIDIPYTAQFNLPSVEVLKFTAGAENQVVTLVEFDNGDVTDFEPNEFVKFDGTMSIKTEYSYDMRKDENIDSGFLSVVEFDKSKFKEIASLEVSEKVTEQTMNEKILDMIRNR